MNQDHMSSRFASLAASLPPLVPATELPGHLNNLYSPKYLANLRWSGKGPRCIKVGRKVAYLREDVITWLEAEAREFTPDAE